MATESIVIDVQINQSEAADKLAGVTKEVVALTNEQKKLRQSIKEGTGDTRANAVALADVTDKLKTAKAAQSALEGRVVASMKVGQSYGTSLKEQAQALKALRDQYGSLTEEELKSAGGQQMLKHIQDLDKAYKDQQLSMGNTAVLVGDYANQIQVASNSISGMKQQLADLNTKLNSMDINSQDFKDTKDVIDKLSLAVDQASGKVDEFGNREPKNIAKKNFEDTMVTVTILSSSINALSSAFGENEDVQKSLQVATQALAISQSVANVVKEKGAIIDTVTLVKEKALVASKWVLNTVTKVFGITSTQAWAAATLGVSLLIAGIIALVSNFQAIIGAVKEFFGVTNEFAETEKQINNLSKALDGYGEKTSRVTERLKAEGKTEQELLDFKKRRYEEELKLNQDRYNQLTSLTRDLTDKEKEMKAESSEFIRNQNIARYEFETEQIDLNNKAKEKADADEQKRIEDQNKRAEEYQNKQRERQNRSLKFIQELEDATLASMREGADKQIAQLQLTNKREVEEIQNRLKTEKGLTEQDKETLNALIAAKNKALQEKITATNEAASKARFDKEVEAENERLNLLLQSAAKGSEQELKLRKQVIERLRQQELANKELTEQQKLNINAKYDLQLEGAENESIKRRYDAQNLAAQNDFERRKLGIINNEQELVALELEQAQSEADALKAMDEKTKAALFESQAAYEAAVLASEGRLSQAKQKTIDTQNKAVQMQFQVAAKYTEAFGDIMQAFGEDSAAAATFQKGLAIFNSTLKLGEAIAAATATSAAEGIVGALALAGKIAAITSAFAGVISSIKGASAPTAPKFAEGGIVPGGSFSGDNVIARVNSGEMILNDKQQANLLNIANGGQSNGGIDYQLLATMVGQAVSQLPPPVMDYSEFTSFQKSVTTYKEIASI